MFEIDQIKIQNPLLLAPMENVTGIGFRKLCKELGADVVYTEFVNSDGLIRKNKKTAKKMTITEEERPVGIQIYGADIESMVEAAKISETLNPDIIDINAGCWVKKVVKRGAGSGLLKDPDYMEKMVEARKVANKFEDLAERAKAYKENVFSFFETIRYHVDKLELLVDDEIWPLPKYRELLFIK